jgi:hypothetical protein
MMRLGRLHLLAIAMAVTTPASAQSRPDSLSMTCEQVQATLARQGVAVIGTGPHVYDRFVASGRFCSQTQSARQGFIRTKDVPSCLVYTCRDRTLFWEP